MMNVQKYLREGGTLDQLHDELGIEFVEHKDGLATLNYSQINSPKRHPIVIECRGLTLEKGSWNVVARAFPRFFNVGECPDLELNFDWYDFTAYGKEDGSLILLYCYKGKWRVNTRGSFGDGEVNASGKTWADLFRLARSGGCSLYDFLHEDYTYVFELCSPYNKVVRRYAQPTLFLLSSFHNPTGYEVFDYKLDEISVDLKVNRPQKYRFSDLSSIEHFLDEHSDATFEGFVLKDLNGMRLKVKSERWKALHHLHDNGNIFHPKRLLPFILKGQHGEILNHFPEVAPKYYHTIEVLHGKLGRMLAVWEQAKGLESQKDFALYVNKHTGLAPILFQARKTGVDPVEVYKQSEKILLNHVGV